MVYHTNLSFVNHQNPFYKKIEFECVIEVYFLFLSDLIIPVKDLWSDVLIAFYIFNRYTDIYIHVEVLFFEIFTLKHFHVNNVVFVVSLLNDFCLNTHFDNYWQCLHINNVFRIFLNDYFLIWS